MSVNYIAMKVYASKIRGPEQQHLAGAAHEEFVVTAGSTFILRRDKDGYMLVITRTKPPQGKELASLAHANAPQHVLRTVGPGSEKLEAPF